MRRTIITRHGEIGFKLVKVKSLENGSIMRPLLLYIGLEPWKRVVDDLDFECEWYEKGFKFEAL